MTVLVTGASGLIGRHTVARLVAQGEPVRTFQRSHWNAAAAHPPADLQHFSGDVRTDLHELCAAARGCRAIVHLAGRGDVAESRRDPRGSAQINATGALHALEAARTNNAL